MGDMHLVYVTNFHLVLQILAKITTAKLHVGINFTQLIRKNKKNLNADKLHLQEAAETRCKKYYSYFS